MDYMVGYSPWGHKELDMTERLTLSLSKAVKSSKGNRHMENSMRSLKTLGINLPYDSETPLLGTHPEHTTILKDTYPNTYCNTIYNSQREAS